MTQAHMPSAPLFTSSPDRTEATACLMLPYLPNGEQTLRDNIPESCEAAFEDGLARKTIKDTLGSTVHLFNPDGPDVIIYGTTHGKGKDYRVWDCDQKNRIARGFAYAVRLARTLGFTVVDAHFTTQVNWAMLGYLGTSANYQFQGPKSVEGLLTPVPAKTSAPLKTIYILPSGEKMDRVAIGEALGNARNAGRELMNRPAYDLTTLRWTTEIEAWVDKFNSDPIDAPCKVQITVFKDEEGHLFEQGFDWVRAVSAGSDQSVNPGRVIVLEYIPNDKEPRTAIGKGVVFDKGGTVVKPDAGKTMESDMGGAAVALEAFKASIQLYPDLPVRLVIFLVENSDGDKATRNGTPIHSGLLDKTVQNCHPDAEGRYGLAECVAYAIKHWGSHPIVDVATLTGFAGAVAPDADAVVFSNVPDLAFHVSRCIGIPAGDVLMIGESHDGVRKDLDTAGGLWGMGNIGTRKQTVSLAGHAVGFEFATQAGNTPDCAAPIVHLDVAPGSGPHPADNGAISKGFDAPAVASVIHLLGHFREVLALASIPHPTFG